MFCGNIAEDNIHILCDCSLVIPLWSNVIHVNARYDFFQGDLKHWISFNMISEVGWQHEVEWKSFWATNVSLLVVFEE